MTVPDVVLEILGAEHGSELLEFRGISTAYGRIWFVDFRADGYERVCLYREQHDVLERIFSGPVSS